MLPICVTSPCCSYSQIHLNQAVRYLSGSTKTFHVTCLSRQATVLDLPNGIHLPKVSISAESTNPLFSDFVGTHKFFSGSTGYMKYVQNSTAFLSELELEGLTDTTKDADAFSEYPESDSILSLESLKDTSGAVPDSPTMDTNLLSNLRENIKDLLPDLDQSVGTSVRAGITDFDSSIDEIKSFIAAFVESGNKAVDALIGNVIFSVDQAGELTRSKFNSLSGDLQQGSGKVGFIALDLLRQTIIAVEDSLAKGITFISYSYGSVKGSLPPEIQNVLNLSEERTRELSRPVAMVFEQVYSVIEGLERSLGLDPSDPLIQFAFLLGASSFLWIVFWLAIYGGYAGDLSPDLALQLLSSDKNAVLIDGLRERDGIPDLRRGARFRYANVSIPEVDDSTRKLLKGGKELDDILTAVVIRNLKNVGDRSKIIIMDSDGTRSKGIARSLSKLGLKGLRIKEVKPETALTILNEEAEAILEELKPSPLQLFGITMGSVAALYALLEWEKSLQLIGIIGIGQSIYRRVASYEDYKDLEEDARLLLAPINLGAQAISWATGKLETNGLGLPTSPSSVDVQSRVLQAAAKHESQPSEAEEVQNSSSDSTVPVDENADLSEA
ncbi:Calcium sensing receptor, chloroplastic-like protein [Drosera capensis]